MIAINVGVYLLVTLPLSYRGVDLNDPAVIEYIRAMGGRFNVSHLMQISAYDLFTFAHGYKPGAPEISDLFASMFLHGGLLHLAGNMLFLWIFGDNVEHRLGRFGYLLAYLGTGVVATLAFSLFAMHSMVPLVGASGAISGVLGIYFHQFPRNKIKVFIALFPFFFDVVLLPARWVLGFYVIVDNLLPLLLGHRSGIAYGAHLGGFLGGLGVAWLAESFGWQVPWKDPNWRVGRRRTRRRAQTHIDKIRQAVALGDHRRALEQVVNLGREDVAALDPAECVLLANWLERAGHHVASSTLLRRCLATHPGSKDLSRVYLALGLNRLRQGQPTAAFQHLQSVFDYDPPPEVAEAARRALSEIDFYRGR